jgi:hypothetical protein
VPAASNDEIGAAARASAKAKAHVLFSIDTSSLCRALARQQGFNAGGSGVGGYHFRCFTLIRPHPAMSDTMINVAVANLVGVHLSPSCPESRSDALPITAACSREGGRRSVTSLGLCSRCAHTPVGRGTNRVV